MIKLLFVWLLLTCSLAYGQDSVFVNTDNLVLRDRPEAKYMVFAILHAPCRLKVETKDHGYENNKAVHAKFYHVSVSYKTDSRNNYIEGWVMKKYVVSAKERVTASADMDVDVTGDRVDVSDNYSYTGKVKSFNAGDFRAPVYKGGEPQVKSQAAKRVYRIGPRGGCYYVNGKSNKVYVDSKYCAGKTNTASK